MSKISLLVADDEPIVLAFIKHFIEESALPVSVLYEATNGSDAVALALRHAPDLILLDIRMPGLNGLEAAKAILEGQPEAKIIMVTAYDEFEYVRSALRSGVTDYLLKPLSHDSLSALISATLETKKLRVQNLLAAGGEAVHPTVLAVTRYVEAHLDSPLRLEDIAAAVFMSPSHCSRTFRKYSGLGINELISQRRTAKAVELLESSFMSVTEIAEALGFSSATYFTTWFKKSTGSPPLQFRKKNLP